MKPGDLGATGLYWKPKKIHAPKPAETLVSERRHQIYRDEYLQYGAKTAMNGKRVGLYLRVSTGDQSIETQRMGLVAACEARGWRIVGEFEDKRPQGSRKAPRLRPAFESGDDPQDRCCRRMVG